MATTDQELKTLNKTVNEAVNILKIYVGNSAQIKAMNQEERAMIERWLVVTDMQEEQQKRQRAFTERARDKHGRFIKKREGAWGKFLDMAESTVGFIDKITFGIAGKFKNMVKNITSHLTNFFSELKSHFLSLFGEESEWFGLLRSIKDSITGIMGTVIGWIWKKTPNWAKKMIKHLGNIYALQVKQMKLDFASAGGTTKKKVSWGGLLAALVFSIGAGIGAFMHRYFVLITKLPMFSKVMKLFKGIEAIPFIGKLVKGLKFGFKWLGWPLTLILSVIDFIKGFRESKGETMWEKIKDGLWAAVEGFIGLPVKFIGWVVEKVAGLFGVELDGVGDKIMGWLREAFDFLLDINPIKPITNFFIGFFSKDGSFMEKIKAGFQTMIDSVMDTFDKWVKPVIEVISPIITGVIDFFKDIWNTILDWMIGKVPSWLPKKESLINTLTGMKIEDEPIKTEPTRYSVAEAQRAYTLAHLTDQQKRDLEMAQGMKDIWLAQKEGSRGTQTALNNIATIQQNNQGGGGDVRQIPDEVDNSMLGVNVYGGGMR